MITWRRQEQPGHLLLQSIRRRLQLMQRQLERYPANEELLFYMLDEVQCMRQELIDLSEQRYYRLLLPVIQSVQIQMTPMQQELYRRLSECRSRDYILPIKMKPVADKQQADPSGQVSLSSSVISI